jgi:hypothetical protein
MKSLPFGGVGSLARCTSDSGNILLPVIVVQSSTIAAVTFLSFHFSLGPIVAEILVFSFSLSSSDCFFASGGWQGNKRGEQNGRA